jgi:hypothetical protein
MDVRCLTFLLNLFYNFIYYCYFYNYKLGITIKINVS